MKRFYHLMGFIYIGIIGLGCGRFATPPATTVESASRPTVTATPMPATVTLIPPTVEVKPTASPTPWVYEVQSGDTILSIAAKVNRSTTALQTINGLLDPRQLTVGQRLIIPPQTASEGVPTITPTPFPLNVEAVNFYSNASGSLWGLGEIHNPYGQVMTGVEIEATLLDGNGVVLDRARAFSQLEVIPSQETVPIAILFTAPPPDFAQYQFKVITAMPLPAQNRYYFDLTVSDLEGQIQGASLYRITGQLYNQGKYPAESIRLVAVAYKANGQIIAQRQANLGVTLLKQEATTPFIVDLITHETVDHYHVFVESLQAK